MVKKKKEVFRRLINTLKYVQQMLSSSIIRYIIIIERYKSFKLDVWV